MYVNKCIKCGAEFETKNPKRVICPNCLYPDKNMMPSGGGSDNHEHNSHDEQKQEQQDNMTQGYSSDGGYSSGGSYSAGGYSAGGYSAGGYSTGGYERPQRNNYNQGGYQAGGGYDRPQRSNYNQGGYQSRGGYSSGGYDRPQRSNYNQGGGYKPRNNFQDRNQGGYSQRGGYSQNRSQGNYQSRGGYNSGRTQNSFQQRRPGGTQRRPGGMRPQRPQPQKQLLISKEQLEQIEALYKTMLPLPNPDAHEVIGEKIGLEPKKVFFGINLIRQKMMLPKLPFPKRKLAISPDQLLAIRSLYEPLLPLPPIGCHKIIAIQLKIDEWRVHVGIGLIRSQMGLDRWNPDRDDAPEEFKKKEEKVQVEEKTTKAKKTTRTKKVKEEKAEVSDVSESETEQKVEKKIRGRKPKKSDDGE